MQHTKITVSYGRTQSLQSYSNVKPQVSVEATLDADDDPAIVRAALLAEARTFVHEVIDQALEDDEQPAKFSLEPRYGLYFVSEVGFGNWNEFRRTATPPERLVVVVPEKIRLDRMEGEARAWWNRWGSHRMRFAHALRVAEAYVQGSEGCRLVICADGDLARLPTWCLEPPTDPGLPAPVATESERAGAGDDVLDSYDNDEGDEDEDC